MAVQIPNFSFLAQPTVTQGFSQAQDTMGRMGANKAQQIQNQALPGRLQAQLQAQQLANQSQQQQNRVQPQSLQQSLQSQIYANQVAKAKGKYADPMAQAQLGVEEQRPGLMGAQTQLANIQAQQAPEKLRLQGTGNLASTMRQANVWANTPQGQAILSDPDNAGILKQYGEMGVSALHNASQQAQGADQGQPQQMGQLGQALSMPAQQQGVDPMTGQPMQQVPQQLQQLQQDPQQQDQQAQQEEQPSSVSAQSLEGARVAIQNKLAKGTYTTDQLDRLSRANNLVTLFPQMDELAEDAFKFAGQTGAAKLAIQARLPASQQSEEYKNYVLFDKLRETGATEYAALAGAPKSAGEAEHIRELTNPISKNTNPEMARSIYNQWGSTVADFANNTAKGPGQQVQQASAVKAHPLAAPGQGQLGAAMSKNGADNYQAAPTGMVSMVAKNGEMHYVPSASVAAAKEKFGLREVS